MGVEQRCERGTKVWQRGPDFFASNVSPVTASSTTLLLSVIRGVAALFMGCKRRPQKSRSL
jgi:hypothetical protein